MASSLNPSKLRIGLAIYGSLDTVSGGYLYDRMLVRELVLAGHEVCVYPFVWNDYTKHLLDNCSIRHFHQLRDATVDLWLQDELNHPSLAWLNYRLRKDRPIPLVSIVHHLRSSESHPAPLLPLYRYIERRYLHSLDGYLANSRTTQGTVEKLLQRRVPSLVAYPAADQLPVREPAVTPEELAARSQAPGPLRVLFVGNIIPRKGLHTLISALALVNRGHWTLSIVGSEAIDPRYARAVRKQVAQANLTQQVTWHGRVPDSMLVDLYRRHQLFALPAYEGFGIVYLEAMRFGLPVLAATAGAAHEIVTPGVDGYLMDLDDVNILAELVEKLAVDRLSLHEISEAARTRYVRHPSWQQSMRRAVAWLEEMAGSP